MPIHKNCITCGNQFTVPPCRSVAKYCCQNCMPKAGSSNPNFKGGLVHSNCLECGKDTYVKKSHAAKGSGKYCSNSCKGKAHAKLRAVQSLAKRIIKKCIVCNAEISVKPSHQHIEGTYCSYVCMSNDYKTRMSGLANPNFKHGKSHMSNYYAETRKHAEGSYPKELPAHMYLLQRGKCANCKKALKNKYHVDHIHPIAKGGTNYPENLQLLCASCNCKKHAKDPFVWANENGRLL